jgi:hypothetical protein
VFCARNCDGKRVSDGRCNRSSNPQPPVPLFHAGLRTPRSISTRHMLPMAVRHCVEPHSCVTATAISFNVMWVDEARVAALRRSGFPRAGPSRPQGGAASGAWQRRAAPDASTWCVRAAVRSAVALPNTVHAGRIARQPRGLTRLRFDDRAGYNWLPEHDVSHLSRPGNCGRFDTSLAVSACG